MDRHVCINDVRFREVPLYLKNKQQQKQTNNKNKDIA